MKLVKFTKNENNFEALIGIKVNNKKFTIKCTKGEFNELIKCLEWHEWDTLY